MQAVRKLNRTLLPVTFEPGGAVWTLQLDSGATNAVVNCVERCPAASNVAPQGRLLTHTGEQEALLGTLRQIAIGGNTMPSADAVLMEGTRELEDGVMPARWFDAFYVSGQTVRFDPAR